MEKIIIKSTFKNSLCGYYLEDKFRDDPESGLEFISDDSGTIVSLNYENKEDLETKISYILDILTDK